GLENFDLSVAGDEVERNKPDPCPYLKAARLLGVDPARCVAFEDSPTGVASALAAGCLTVAVPMMVPLEPADGLILLDTLDGVGRGAPAAQADGSGHGAASGAHTDSSGGAWSRVR